MKTSVSILISSLMLLASTSLAFHSEKHGKPFPGAPSGKFQLIPILAGETCTDAVSEPDGMDMVLHGGPKKFGFIGEQEIEVLVLSSDPDVVQVCFVDEMPRPDDVMVRVSFEEEVVVVPE